MCRIAAYTGPPAPLASLLYAPTHSLDEQAYRPREMVSGTVNVDGTGVAWWSGADPEPLRYVTTMPPWSDPNLPTLARRLCGAPILATVRSATPGIPVENGAVLPFVHETIAGSHNGYLERFSDGVAARCLGALSAGWQGQIGTLTDSRLLFLLALQALDEAPGAGLLGACETAVTQVATIARGMDRVASLNLVLADRDSVCAARFARGVRSNSLYTSVGSNGARRLASEPLDDDDWTPVPDRHLLRMTADQIEVTPSETLARLE